MSPEDNTNWCGGTGSMLSCDYKGDLYPCIRYMESSIGDDAEPLIIGNVYDGLLHNDVEKERLKCLRCITRRSQSTDECFNCPIAQNCSWCSAYNYQTFGTADHRATFICIMHKARALANAYYWNKGFHKYAPFFRFKIWIPEEWASEIITRDEWLELCELEKFEDADLEACKNYEVPEDCPEYAVYRKNVLITGEPIITNESGEKTYIHDTVTIDGSVIKS